MIIPITKGSATAPGAPAQGMPSETNLMMALATMHEQGRFQVAGDVIDKSKEFSDISKSNRLQNAGGFHPGVPSAKVLPMTPDKDK